MNEDANEQAVPQNVEPNPVQQRITDINSITSHAKKEKIENLRVSADPIDISSEERKKRAKRLAGAIGHAIRTNGEINVRCFGKETIYKAAKSLAIARDYIKATHPNLELAYSPAFIEAQVDNGTMTGICFCTFASEKGDREVDLSKVKSVLMVKADPKEISSEERKERVRKLAGAITHAVSESNECVIRAFGKAAVSKAAKALAIARGFTATKGPDLYCWNDFIMADMQGAEKTGIVFYAFTNAT